ncbi:MAG: gliding motility-associated C-terminal domain-containing protein [Phaeodactylibacter sp.]|nr:gliding motility-associated C-terminal domain-containing protein [Phaeodactylibacter sp.]
MGKLYNKLFIFLLSLLAFPAASLACDGSGYVINGLIDNNDGTFTINMTIHIAGANYPGGILGGTQGFYFGTGSPILNVSPASLTSQNGTTFNAVVAGNTVTWGTPGAGPFFVQSFEPTQLFNVTVVVQGFPGGWNGGGMENNGCPGGPGTSNPSPGYSGTFCLPPTIMVAPSIIDACAGDQVTLTAINSPGTNVNWSNGMSGPSITFTVNNSTVVTGTASSSCGSASESVTINVTPQPAISPIPNFDICEGDLINISALAQNADFIEWSTGNVGNNIVYQPLFSETVTVTASNVCSSVSTSFNINVTPLPLLFVIQGDQTICEGQIATLEVLYENATSFNWNPGPPNLSTIQVSPTQTQIYTATASNQCATLEETIIVDVASLPSIDIIQGDQSICIGESVTMEVFTIDAASTSWSIGGTGSTRTFTPTETQTVTVTATNNCGSVQEEILIEVSTGPALEVIDGGQEICPGESVTLTVSPEAADNILWSNGSTDTTITVSPGQTEIYTLSLTNICGTTDTTFEVSVLENPAIEVLQGDQDICIGDSATLEIDASLATALAWSTGAADTTAITVMPGQTETYDLTASNRCGQTDTSFTVNVLLYPTVDIVDGDQTICQGESAAISVEAANEDVFSWNTGATDSLITVNPGQTQTYTATVSNFCGEDSEQITVTVNPVYDTNLELEACSGTVTTYNGTELDPGESQAFTLATADGCDSVVNVTVIELPVFESDLQLEACTGTSVTYESTVLNPGDSQSFTLTAQNGCDSVVHVNVMELLPVEEDLELEACPNTTVTYEGTTLAPGDSQDFLFTAQNGCDSTVHVSVIELPVFESDLALEACTGTTVEYEGTALDPGAAQSFTLTAANGCDSVVNVSVLELAVFESDLQLEACTGSTATFDGTELQPGAAQSFTYTAANGCDSTINVSVLELPVFESDLQLQACSGTTVDYNGTTLDAGQAQSFILTAANGCDSVVNVNVLELAVFESGLQLAACPGTSVTYNGTDLLAGTGQSFTLTAANGCDSVVNVEVMELPVFESDLQLAACPGASVTYNGESLDAGESRSFTLTAINGCDSVVNVEVAVLPTFEADVALEACTGSTATFDGTELQPGASQTFAYTAVNGCDSIINVSVIELPVYDQDMQLEACTGTTVEYNGMDLPPGFSDAFTFATQDGCDSVVNVTVLELQIFEADVQLEACTGTTTMFDGMVLNPGASERFVYTAANGCDSTINVTVLELPVFESDLELRACTGTTVDYNGETLDPGAAQSFTLTAVNGCDSVVNVSVLELAVFESDLQLEACPGTFVTYNGTDLLAGTGQPFTLMAANGCDSVVNVEVMVLPVFESSLELEACPGTTATYNGESLDAGESRAFTLTAANGCDSVVNVSVAVLPTFEDDVALEACTGSTAIFDGTPLQPGESRSFTYTAANGCDSTINVAVMELPVYEQDLQLQACTGNTVFYNGMNLPPGFEDTFVYATQDGCDSTVNVFVEEVDILEESLEFFTCPETTVTYEGTALAPGDVQDFQFTSQNGCDSIVTVSVLALPTFETELRLEACTGTSVTYNGTVLNPGDSQPFTFIAGNGCDSTVFVSVAELQVYESGLELQACPGEQVTYNGTMLPAGASQDFVLSAQNGCDSTVHVEVLVLPTYEQDLPLQACLGTTITYNGTVLAPGDSQSFLLASQFGCDSVVNVSVEGVEVFESSLNLQACSGSTADYNGTSLQAGEVQDFTFTSQIGCDSIVTVSVIELPVYEQQLQLQTCEGTTTTYNGATLAPGAEQDFLFTTAAGCDSLIHVTVIGVDNILTDESRAICSGDSSLIFGAYESQPGPYSAVFTAANGCDSTHTVFLSTTPLPQPVAEIQASCPDKDNGTIDIQVSGGMAPYTFIWSDGAIAGERDELAPGAYTVTATDARGCRQALPVTVPERSLEVEIEAKDISCFGEDDGLISLQGNGTGLTYQLNDGPLMSSGFFTALGPGRYVARAEDSYGCRYELGALVIEEPEELQVRLPEDTTIRVGYSIRIQAQASRTSGLAYSWNPSDDLDCADCEAPVASPPFTVRYEVTVRDSSGCVAEDDIFIFVDRRRNVYIPNVFSPNEDGSNDKFLIFGDETVVNIRSLKIFNRWGESVYEGGGFPPNNPAFGWDGTFRGQVMNSAVFAYLVEVEFSDGAVELFHGDVLLMR